MPKKCKRPDMTEENELFPLPSSNDEMRSFIDKFKTDLLEQVVRSIEYAIENRQGIVEVFQFKNTNFVVTIDHTEFESNLENVHTYYMEHELYELVPRVVKLREIIKYIHNEKEIPKKGFE
jgi:hypothetical protein